MFVQQRYKDTRSAKLISDKLPATNGQCFSVSLFMYGPGHSGNINIYLINTKSSTIQTYILSLQHSWYQMEVGLYSRTSFQIVIEGVILPNHVGIVAIDDLNIKDGNCITSCSSIPPGKKVACGPADVSSMSCIRDHACCYSNHNSPACFYHPSSCQSIAIADRVKCGSHNIREYSCKRMGCCYDSDTSDLPFRCYNSPITPTAFPSTLAPTTTPAPSQYDCTFEKGLCNFVNLKSERLRWVVRTGGSNIGIQDHTLQNDRGRSWFLTNFWKEPPFF